MLPFLIGAAIAAAGAWVLKEASDSSSSSGGYDDSEYYKARRKQEYKESFVRQMQEKYGKDVLVEFDENNYVRKIRPKMLNLQKRKKQEIKQLEGLLCELEGLYSEYLDNTPQSLGKGISGKL